VLILGLKLHTITGEAGKATGPVKNPIQQAQLIDIHRQCCLGKHRQDNRPLIAKLMHGCDRRAGTEFSRTAQVNAPAVKGRSHLCQATSQNYAIAFVPGYQSEVAIATQYSPVDNS